MLRFNGKPTQDLEPPASKVTRNPIKRRRTAPRVVDSVTIWQSSHVPFHRSIVEPNERNVNPRESRRKISLEKRTFCHV